MYLEEELKRCKNFWSTVECIKLRKNQNKQTEPPKLKFFCALPNNSHHTSQSAPTLPTQNKKGTLSEGSLFARNFQHKLLLLVTRQFSLQEVSWFFSYFYDISLDNLFEIGNRRS